MRKILLIESDEKLARRTKEFLERHNLEVIVSTEGTSAIQKALEFFPDIILCDSNIPGLNGYEIFNTLLQINSTAIIPFVFLMNGATSEDVRAAMNLGADDYLNKPYDFENLLQLIEIRLEKQEKIIGLADEKFNTLMEYSSDAVFIYQDEKFSYVNKKFCDLVAYSKREIIGMNLVNIIFKDDIQLVIDKISKLMKGIFKSVQVEFKMIKGNQDVETFIMIGDSLSFKGKKSIIGTLKLKEDISNNIFITKKTEISLTQREREVLEYICEGYSNSKIAEELNLSERTIEGHRANIMNKTNCQNTASLAIFAVKYGFYKII